MSSEDKDDNVRTPPRKKAKKNYETKYKKEWEKGYSYITKSSKGNKFAFCAVCTKDFSVKSGMFHLHTRYRLHTGVYPMPVLRYLNSENFELRMVSSLCYTLTGVGEIKKHKKNMKHVTTFGNKNLQPSVCNMTAVTHAQRLSTQRKTAVLRLSRFVVKHNLAFNIMNHFPKLCAAAFPD